MRRDILIVRGSPHSSHLLSLLSVQLAPSVSFNYSDILKEMTIIFLGIVVVVDISHITTLYISVPMTLELVLYPGFPMFFYIMRKTVTQFSHAYIER